MEIPEVVKALLRATAPTLAAAIPLPPPFGLIASAAVTAALKHWLPAGVTPGQPQANGAPPALTPDQITGIIQANAGDPQLSKDLALAEIELKREEQNLPYKFAELELQFAKLAVDDRTRAGDRANAGGEAERERVYQLGMSLLREDKYTSYVILVGGMTLLGVTAFTRLPIDPNFSNVVFSLLGLLYGKKSSRADQVVNYLYGSSAGSREKQNIIGDTFDRLGRLVGDIGTRRPPQITDQSGGPPETIPVPAAPVIAGGSVTVSGDNPAAEREDDVVEDVGGRQPSSGMAQIKAAIEALRVPHRQYESSIRWALTDEGISVNEGSVMRTPGQPITVRRIWADYGPLITKYAKVYGEPIETIVATIATESGGNPKSFRQEPKDASAGLMQTLLGTARSRESLNNPALTIAELYEPETSIHAGVAYIASQRNKTAYDPILVAAAYNAGGIRKAPNRWGLYCYTPQGGEHLENFSKYFGDAMVACASDGWYNSGAPSFVSAFKE